MGGISNFEDIIEFGDDQVLKILKMMDLVLSGFNLVMSNCNGNLDKVIEGIQEAKKNNINEFEIWGTGKPIREHCYIDDLVKLIRIIFKNKED